MQKSSVGAVLGMTLFISMITEYSRIDVKSFVELTLLIEGI
jgi:hypothetical protein